MSIKSTNKRVSLTLNKNYVDYLNSIINIYNEQNLKLPFPKRKKNFSLSILFYIAIGNLIMQIDKQIDVKQSREYNHKAIYNFLSGKNAFK